MWKPPFWVNEQTSLLALSKPPKHILFEWEDANTGFRNKQNIGVRFILVLYVIEGFMKLQECLQAPGNSQSPFGLIAIDLSLPIIEISFPNVSGVSRYQNRLSDSTILSQSPSEKLLFLALCG